MKIKKKIEEKTNVVVLASPPRHAEIIAVCGSRVVFLT